MLWTVVRSISLFLFLFHSEPRSKGKKNDWDSLAFSFQFLVCNLSESMVVLFLPFDKLAGVIFKSAGLELERKLLYWLLNTCQVVSEITKFNRFILFSAES